METTTSQENEPNNIDFWRQALAPIFKDKKIIITGEVVASILPRARMLRELGAQSTFMLATEGTGTGEPPSDDDDPWTTLNLPAAEDLTQAIEQSNRALESLPMEAIAKIESFDPGNEAVVVGTFLHEPASVADRPSLAYRKPEWLALDDKTVIDQLWDEVGIPREPYRVIEVDESKITEAMQELDKGGGVVLSGDARDGAGGGATGVKWITSSSDINRSIGYFQKHCDRLRVMPFLEGIPCSIHGMVFDDYIAAFRPVEMMVLRKQDTNEFFYAGTSTYWDPEPSDREDMRTTAKRVGAVLKTKVDYRGIFTMDGVMTEAGFRPTELNPRSGAGIKPLIAAISDLPLELLAQASVSGAKLDYRPQELEQFILENADKSRGGGTWKALSKKLPPLTNKPIKLTEHGWEWSDDEDNNDGTVSIGPGPLGSFVRLSLKSSSVPVGSSFAPLAQSFWALIDKDFNAEIGELDIASVVR